MDSERSLINFDLYEVWIILMRETMALGNHINLQLSAIHFANALPRIMSALSIYFCAKLLLSISCEKCFKN